MANSKTLNFGPEAMTSSLEGVHIARPRSARANELSGAEWTRNSISVWRDIKKRPEELRIKHPAMFPVALVERVLDCFTSSKEIVVLDPFMGSGATLVAARNRGKQGIGFEIYEKFVSLTRMRLSQGTILPNAHEPKIFQEDARKIRDYLAPGSVDICVTSPPYWNILTQKRTADYKSSRPYGELSDDLATVGDYGLFLVELARVFRSVQEVLKPARYCIINVMDIRKKDKFYPFHADLSRQLSQDGWIFDDLIIWDRGAEYNNLRPLGYPSVFRINKIHEYLLIFKKPALKGR